MDKCLMVIQASTQRVADVDRVVSRESCSNIPVSLSNEICEDFNDIEIDLPHMRTTGESGRLLVMQESAFLHAICNMCQTCPRDIEIALISVDIFRLHPNELHFLHVCNKHKLHLNKYLFTN